MPVISISLPGELLDRLDFFVKEGGYSSRSEAIRQTLRSALSDYALTRTQKGWVMATTTVIFSRLDGGVSQRLMALRHEFDELISGNMHLHMGDEYCVEIFIAMGDAESVLEFLMRIRSIRDIQQVRYTMIPLSKNDLSSE
ncbi:MAG: CopG family ribbon-helix-helix protein [Candidatus Bathyarchaeia archaeon]